MYKNDQTGFFQKIWCQPRNVPRALSFSIENKLVADVTIYSEGFGQMLKKRLFVLSFFLILISLGGCPDNSAKTIVTTAAIEPSVARERPELNRLLNYYDQHYDPSEQMLKVPFEGTGYHSRVVNGTEVHPTRESLYYAVALLQRGRTKDVSVATEILRKVLPLQQTDLKNKFYGVWPWLLEEPLEKMSSVDFNWADFCGSAIAQILVKHQHQLADEELIRQLKKSLKRSTVAIRNRNVNAGYSNIAVLGGGVCAVTGEILEDPELLEYGRNRLQKVVLLTEQIKGFGEYNSPTYGKVVIGECERILQLSKDRQVREYAETIRVAAWQIFAVSFHLRTNQWAGPHSRLSKRRLTDTLVIFLNQRTGLNIQPHPRAITERPRGYGIVTPIACPETLLEELKESAKSTQVRNRTFKLGGDGKPAIFGTTWKTSDACLGSVNRASFWTQRNPISAYWRTNDDPAVAFRVQFLRDGKDFASLGVRAVQSENRILFAAHSLLNRGDWHRTLDRPVDGRFEAADFRLRLELDGQNVVSKKRAEGGFALSAGDQEIVVFPADSMFLGQPVKWQCSKRENGAYVEAVCYSGKKRVFDFNKLVKMQLATAIQLQTIGTPSQTTDFETPVFESSPNRDEVSWQGLKIAVPANNN